MDSKSGTVSLALENGTTVEAPSLEVAEAVFCFIATMPEGEVTAGSVCSVEVGNGDKLEKVEVDGTSVQFLVNNGILQFNVPTTAGADSKVKLISSNGEVEYDFPFVPLTKPEIEIWSGSWVCGNWEGNQDLAWGGYDWTTVASGTALNFYYTLDSSAAYWQLRVAQGDGWVALTGTPDPYDLTGTTSLSVVLTEEMLDDLQNNGGLVVTGRGFTLTRITLQ